MPDAAHATPRPARRKDPFPWFKFRVAEILASPGVAMVWGDTEALAAMMRFAAHSWMTGPVPDSDLEAVCGSAAGAAKIRSLLLEACEGGWRMRWLEQARTDADRTSREQSERRRGQHVSTHTDPGQPRSTADNPGATPVDHETRRDETREEKSRSQPPLPPSGADTKARTRSARRVPAEPWESVLERSEYRELANDHEFMAAWWSWVTHTRTAGAKAREPRGSQAAAILNVALREGAKRFAAAVEASIAGNWQGIHYPDGRSGGADTRSDIRPPSKTDLVVADLMRQAAQPARNLWSE